MIRTPTTEAPSTNDALIDGLRQAGSVVSGCPGAKAWELKVRRRLLLECTRRERVPAALSAAVRAAATSRVEEVRAKHAAAGAEDVAAKRHTEELDMAQLKLKRAQIEGRTAHRRLLLHQGTVQSARALAAEAQASERARAKKVRCEYATWFRIHLVDTLSAADLEPLSAQATARANLGRATSSCPTTCAVRGLALARATT